MDYFFNLLHLGYSQSQTNKKQKNNIAAAFIMPINMNGDIAMSNSESNIDLDLLLFRPHKQVTKDNNQK